MFSIFFSLYRVQKKYNNKKNSTSIIFKRIIFSTNLKNVFYFFFHYTECKKNMIKKIPAKRFEPATSWSPSFYSTSAPLTFRHYTPLGTIPQSFFTYLPMKMEQTVCSETSAYKIQTPGNYPEENIQHDTTRLRRRLTFSIIFFGERRTR